MMNENKLLSTVEAAAFLNIKIGTLYQLKHKKIISCYKPNGGKIYFDKNDLLEYQSRNKIESVE